MNPTSSLRALWLSSVAALLASPAVAQQAALEKEFEAKLQKVNQDSPDDLLELAAWAQGKGLKDKARMVFFRVIRKDPNNEEARAALGHVKSGDKWLTGDEVEKARKAGKLEPVKAPDAAAGAKGTGSNGSGGVERVEPPKEAEIRAAVKEARDAHAKEMEVLKQHYVDEMGVDKQAFNTGRSEHQLILAKADAQEIENLLCIAEETYTKLNCLGFLKPEADTFGKSHPCIAYLVEGGVARESLEFLNKEHPAAMGKETLKEALEFFKKGSRGFSSIGGPMQLTARAEEANSLQFHRSAIANAMGHNWLWWNVRTCRQEAVLGSKGKKSGGRVESSLIHWLGEGFGIWASKDLLGTNLLYRVTKTEYGNDSGKADKGKDPDSMYLEFCYEIALGKAKDAKTFYEVTKQDLNSLDDKSLAVAWSVVDYLIKERLEQFRMLLKGTRSKPSFRMVFIDTFGDDAQREQRKQFTHDGELDDLYRTVCGKFEIEWRAWVKAQTEYRVAFDSPGKIKSKPKREFPGDPKGGDEKGKGAPKKPGKK